MMNKYFIWTVVCLKLLNTAFVNMDTVTDAHRADMHFYYGFAGGNASEAIRLYQESYPLRYCPNYRYFINLQTIR